MADDIETDGEDLEPDEELEAELEEGEDLEPDDIDDELIDDEFEELAEDDDDELAGDDEDDDEEDDEERPARRPAAEDEDEDEDLLTPDDVEADLDTILKDRLVAADESTEDEDEDQEPEDRTETGDRLQPKRADEQLCPSCFLLVRAGAPGCPVGDDNCPIFTR